MCLQIKSKSIVLVTFYRKEIPSQKADFKKSILRFMITLCFAPLRFIFKNIYINKKMPRSHRTQSLPAGKAGIFSFRNRPMISP